MPCNQEASSESSALTLTAFNIESKGAGHACHNAQQNVIKLILQRSVGRALFLVSSSNKGTVKTGIKLRNPEFVVVGPN